MRVLRLDSCRAFCIFEFSLLKCLRKASIYRSLGVGERHVAKSVSDTCHSLIGPPMSSLTRARSLVSSLTCAEVACVIAYTC